MEGGRWEVRGGGWKVGSESVWESVEVEQGNAQSLVGVTCSCDRSCVWSASPEAACEIQDLLASAS